MAEKSSEQGKTPILPGEELTILYGRDVVEFSGDGKNEWIRASEATYTEDKR